MIKKALYEKYSASQNYYFTKDIHDLLGNAITKNTIKIIDFYTYDDDQEYFKRFYHENEYELKI